MSTCIYDIINHAHGLSMDDDDGKPSKDNYIYGLNKQEDKESTTNDHHITNNKIGSHSCTKDWNVVNRLRNQIMNARKAFGNASRNIENGRKTENKL